MQNPLLLHPFQPSTAAGVPAPVIASSAMCPKGDFIVIDKVILTQVGIHSMAVKLIKAQSRRQAGQKPLVYRENAAL